MGFYPPDALVHEAQRRGIEVLGPDVNRSDVLCRSSASGRRGGRGDEGPSRVRIGLGLRQGPDGARRRGRRRRARAAAAPYRDLGELASRSGAGRDGLERLAWAGACARARGSGPPPGATGAGRSGGSASPAASVRQRGGEQLALPLAVPDGARRCAEQTPWERVTADYGATGSSLDEHPLALLRAGLDPATVTCADARADRRRQRSRRRRAARRPPAPGDREGRDVPADRGRDRRRQRDRTPAGLRAPSARGPDRLAGLDRGPARAARGRDQRRRGERPPDRAARRPARRGPHDRALRRRRDGRAAGWQPGPRRPRRGPPRRPLLRPPWAGRTAILLHEHVYVRHRSYLPSQ